MKKNSELCNVRNAAIVSITYIAVSVYCSLQVMAPGNDAANTIGKKTILLAVVLLVLAPGMSLGVLLVYLRSTYFIRTRDFLNFLSPPQGSPGNPIIDDIVETRGTWVLNTFVKFIIAVWIILLSWAVYVGVRKW